MRDTRSLSLFNYNVAGCGAAGADRAPLTHDRLHSYHCHQFASDPNLGGCFMPEGCLPDGTTMKTRNFSLEPKRPFLSFHFRGQAVVGD
jgi:hypothetical protein